MLHSDIRSRRMGRVEVFKPVPPAAPAIDRSGGSASAVLSLPQAELLTRIDLFARLDRVALARLAACAEAVPVVPGQDLCRVGDAADALYVIASGTFGVYLPDRPGLGE